MGDLPHPSQPPHRRRRQPPWILALRQERFLRQTILEHCPSFPAPPLRLPKSRGFRKVVLFPSLGQPVIKARPLSRFPKQRRRQKEGGTKNVSHKFAPTNAGKGVSVCQVESARRSRFDASWPTWWRRCVVNININLRVDWWYFCKGLLLPHPSTFSKNQPTEDWMDVFVLCCKRFLEVKNNQLERFFSSWIAPNILWPKRKSRKESTRPKNH